MQINCVYVFGRKPSSLLQYKLWKITEDRKPTHSCEAHIKRGITVNYKVSILIKEECGIFSPSLFGLTGECACHDYRKIQFLQTLQFIKKGLFQLYATRISIEGSCSYIWMHVQFLFLGCNLSRHSFHLKFCKQGPSVVPSDNCTWSGIEDFTTVSGVMMLEIFHPSTLFFIKIQTW